MKKVLSFIAIILMLTLTVITPVYADTEILDENKAEWHLRGGMATKLKYLKEKEGWQFRNGDGSFLKKEPSPFRKIAITNLRNL